MPPQYRRKRPQAFRQFLDDMVISDRVLPVSLSIEDMASLIEPVQRFNLDFDDAYQYVAAEKNDLTIVSFDRDFDRTPRGRKTPEGMLLS